MSLGQQTGGDWASNREEASRLYAIITESDGYESISQKNRDFVESCAPEDARPISGKMLFWLRDIKDKLL